MTHDDDAQGRASDPRQQQREIEVLAHAAGDLEIGFDVHEGKAEVLVQDQIGIIDAQLLGIPVLDQPVEHVEIVRKIDDAGRVAVRKSNGHGAGTVSYTHLTLPTIYS